jgi:Tfp pilus assembly protein PilN
MLRTNLSTRPFYNDRVVKLALMAGAFIAVVLTLFNAYQIFLLQGRSRDARTTIAQNDEQAKQLRATAADVRRSMDTAKLDAIRASAREANALIDRRTFSWTELLNHFQSTLPPDVRIAGVMPQIDNEGRRLVQITVYSRRSEDLEAFMDALEQTGAFSGVLSRADQTGEDGVTQSQLQAYYTPVAERPAPTPSETPAEPAGTAPAASEPGKSAAGNVSAPGNTSGGVRR